MALDEKKAARAVSGSTGGEVKKRFQSALFASSVTETGVDVKGGSKQDGSRDAAWAQQMASRLTDHQRRSIILLARVIMAETSMGMKREKGRVLKILPCPFCGGQATQHDTLCYCSPATAEAQAKARDVWNSRRAEG